MASTLLVQPSNFNYYGFFDLPNVTDPAGNGGFDYVNGAICFNSANTSLFFAGHEQSKMLAEISIPAIGGVATVLQSFRDPFEGRINQINPSDPNQKNIGGMFVSGGTLVITAYSYYDGGVTAVASHFKRSTTLSTASIVGPFQVYQQSSDYRGKYAGFFCDIPTEWQASLGGTLLNGAGPHAIASIWSWGPMCGVTNPASLIAASNPTVNIDLTYYPSIHAFVPYCAAASNFYNGTTEINGMVIPDGTRSILFMGQQGLGPCVYQPGGGPVAPPYIPQVWAYDLNELIAVKNGTKQPWDTRPYTTYAMPNITGGKIKGVAYDPSTGRIFVTEYHGNGTRGRIHVFSIIGVTPPTPPPTPPQPTDAVMGPWVLSSAGPWSLCVNNLQTRQVTYVRSILVPATNGGTTGATVEVRTESQACVSTPPPTPTPTPTPTEKQLTAIAFSTTGAHEIIPAVAGQRIEILNGYINAAGQVSITYSWLSGLTMPGTSGRDIPLPTGLLPTGVAATITTSNSQRIRGWVSFNYV